MRRTKRYKVTNSNSLWQIYKTVAFWKVMKNFLVIQLARYTPFLQMKNWLYKTFLNMKVGDDTAFSLMVMPYIMISEMIQVGRTKIIGYNTTILAHEQLIKEYRLEQVIIGDDVLIGAHTTILPGVTIGNGAVVSAKTLVNKDVAPGEFVGGNPMQQISKKEKNPPENNIESILNIL